MIHSWFQRSMTKLNFFSPQTSAHSLLRFFIINIAVAAVKSFLDREDSRKPFPGRSKRRTSREEIGKWINKHLGLPKRVAPGIRLHRKAEKSVHFLLRWLGTPSVKMKSIPETHLTPTFPPLSSMLFQGVFNHLSGQAGLGGRRGITILDDAEASGGG